MEPLSLSIMVAAAGKVLDSLLGGEANKLVATVFAGVIGNRADRLVCEAAGSSWDFFKNIRTQDPALNHDLERGTREAYLLATLELIRQAELRIELGTSSRLMTAGDSEVLARMRKAIEGDLRVIDNTLPQPLTDAHLFLVDPDAAPAERLNRLRESLRNNLAHDFRRWLPDSDVPEVVGELLKDGWMITTRLRHSVSRDWYSLIAIAFMEKLKTNPRLSTVFESRLLAQIAAREPAAAPMASFSGFTANLDRITAPLQRVEDTLGILSRDITDIKTDVRDIKESVSFLGRIPRLMWMSSALLVVAAATVLATGDGTRSACLVPGVRSACARIGIGGVPSAVEESLWQSRPAGDCGALRSYLSRFPTGAYAAEAGRRLDARVTQTQESWVPEERRQVFTVRGGIVPLESEQRARADALRRAERDSQIVCGPYGQDQYRLRAARVAPETWRCQARAGGFTCGFDGEVVCEVESRHANVVERCQ